MNIGWIVATSLALLLAAGVPASAQMMGSGEQMMGGMMSSAGMHGAAPSSDCPALSAQPTAFGDDGPWISFALAHAQEITLTTEQVRQLTLLRDEFRREAVKLAGEIRAAEAEIIRLRSQPAVDLQAVEGKIRAIAGLEADLRLARVTALEKGKAILTAEQRQTLTSIVQSTGRTHGRMHRMPS
jgi:Spy/CpxP family protein refolding chaperone